MQESQFLISISNLLQMKSSGNNIVLLLIDEASDKYFKSRAIKVVASMASVKEMPHKPRIAELTKESQGYGFFLRMEQGHQGTTTKRYLQEQVCCMFLLLKLSLGKQDKELAFMNPVLKKGVIKSNRVYCHMMHVPMSAAYAAKTNLHPGSFTCIYLWLS